MEIVPLFLPERKVAVLPVVYSLVLVPVGHASESVRVGHVLVAVPAGHASESVQVGHVWVLVQAAHASVQLPGDHAEVFAPVAVVGFESAPAECS